MKWFKHSSISRMERNLVYLMEHFGTHTGYACYFLLLEYCAEHFTSETTFYIHEKTLRQLLGLSSIKTKQYLDRCVELKIFSYQTSGKTFEIDWPQFFEIVDNYSQKVRRNSAHLSEQTSNNVSLDKIRGEKKREEEIRQDVDEIVQCWNSLGLSFVNTNDHNTSKIKNALRFKKNYAAEEIFKAFENYALVLHSPDHFFNFSWSLSDFLRSPKTEKFFDQHFDAADFLNKPFQSGGVIPVKPANFINPFLKEQVEA